MHNTIFNTVIVIKVLILKITVSKSTTTTATFLAMTKIILNVTINLFNEITFESPCPLFFQKEKTEIIILLCSRGS